MSRTGLIIVSSQFCPSELKLEHFSPLTVPPAAVRARSTSRWADDAPGEPVPPYPHTEAEQIDKNVSGSPHTVRTEEEYPVTG